MKSSGRLPDSLRSPHTDMNAHGRLCVFKRQNRARDSFLAHTHIAYPAPRSRSRSLNGESHVHVSA